MLWAERYASSVIYSSQTTLRDLRRSLFVTWDWTRRCSVCIGLEREFITWDCNVNIQWAWKDQGREARISLLILALMQKMTYRRSNVSFDLQISIALEYFVLKFLVHAGNSGKNCKQFGDDAKHTLLTRLPSVEIWVSRSLAAQWTKGIWDPRPYFTWPFVDCMREEARHKPKHIPENFKLSTSSCNSADWKVMHCCQNYSKPRCHEVSIKPYRCF